MTFEIKYDKEGQPLRIAEQVKLPETQAQEQTTTKQPEQVLEGQQAEDHVHDDEPETSAAPVEESPEPAAQEFNRVSENNKNHIRELRLARERAERERDELLRIVQEQQALKSQPKQEVEEDDSISLGDDELAEGKHLSKMGRKIKKLQQELETTRKQTQEQLIQSQIQTQYPDYYRVVNQETLAAFRENYPELAATIASSKDLYSQAVSAYTLIKKFGVYQDPQVTIERETAKKNMAKPKPLASINAQSANSGPLSQANAFANGLTDDVKKALLKEMNDSRRGY